MAKQGGRYGKMFSLAPPLVVLGICLAGTLLSWNIERKNAENQLQLEFDTRVATINDRIDERLDDYGNLLRGAAGLFAASVSVSRNEFHMYVDGLKLPQAFPGIQGMGFARVIPAAGKERVIHEIRKEGFPQFTIKPEGARDPYTAIIYLEPFNWRNQRAFGYDMYSDPVRREAMDRARDTDSPAISGKVVLVQETGREVQSGFLMYLPVYRNAAPHATPQQRRNNLSGWVYEPFRMNDLMTRGVLGRYLDTIRSQLDIEIYDDDSREPGARMFDSSPSTGLVDASVRPHFSSRRVAEHFGRHWTIAVHSLPPFEARLNSRQATFVAIGGVTISLLLTLITWLMATTNVRANNLAKKMSAQLERVLTETIAAMSRVTEMRDPYTAGHQRRAAELARAIGIEMGLDDDALLALYRAALIYEVGKVQIPAEILSKPGKLDPVEYALAKSHAQAGFELLSGIDFPWPIAQIVLQHHERMDGSGYPMGLKADQILPEARIIAVADVVEAMCSHRPYRAEQGLEAALEEITSGRGTRYDAAVVDACIRLFRERGYQLPPHKEY